jgi:hypothetical protein
LLMARPPGLFTCAPPVLFLLHLNTVATHQHHDAAQPRSSYA